MEDIERVLKFLATLSKLSIKFEIDEKESGAIYLKGLDDKTLDLLDAILSAHPDEHSIEEEGLRLWWD